MMLPAVRSEAERDPAFAEWFSNLPGAETTWQCIHCGLCSASCPFSSYMDRTPRRLMHLAREGFKKEVLESATIWLCTSCYECTVKCPREIKVTEIMYALKRRAIDEGAYSRRFPIPVLARQFRDMVLRDGRINEARLVLNLVLRTHPLGMFSMRKLGLGLLRTGRFSLRRDPIEGRHSLATLLEAVRRNGGARDGGAST